MLEGTTLPLTQVALGGSTSPRAGMNSAVHCQPCGTTPLMSNHLMCLQHGDVFMICEPWLICMLPSQVSREPRH